MGTGHSSVLESGNTASPHQPRGCRQITLPLGEVTDPGKHLLCTLWVLATHLSSWHLCVQVETHAPGVWPAQRMAWRVPGRPTMLGTDSGVQGPLPAGQPGTGEDTALDGLCSDGLSSSLLPSGSGCVAGRRPPGVPRRETMHPVVCARECVVPAPSSHSTTQDEDTEL